MFQTPQHREGHKGRRCLDNNTDCITTSAHHIMKERGRNQIKYWCARWWQHLLYGVHEKFSDTPRARHCGFSAVYTVLHTWHALMECRMNGCVSGTGRGGKGRGSGIGERRRKIQFQYCHRDIFLSPDCVELKQQNENEKNTQERRVWLNLYFSHVFASSIHCAGFWMMVLSGVAWMARVGRGI